MATPEPAKAPSRAFMALTSPPAEKARPAPVSTTQRTSRSPFTSSQVAATASPSPGAPSAFRLSGRFRVRIATWPRFSRVRRVMGRLRFAQSRRNKRKNQPARQVERKDLRLKRKGPPDRSEGPWVFDWPKSLLLLGLRGRRRARGFIATRMRREHAREGEGHDGRVQAQLIHSGVSLTSVVARKRRVAGFVRSALVSRQRVNRDYDSFVTNSKENIRVRTICPRRRPNKRLKRLQKLTNRQDLRAPERRLSACRTRVSHCIIYGNRTSGA